MPARPAALRALRAPLALALLAGALAAPAAGAQPAEPPPRLRLVGGLAGDGMVVQRDVPLPVHGAAAPGDTVVVALGGRSATAVADARGRWTATLAALPAGGPHALTVAAGGERLALRDVLVGDVWVASGQSNMEWSVSDARDAAREIAAGRDPMIRHFKVPRSWAAEPAEELAGGAWAAATPETVGGFSAVAWFFARELRRHVDVPIGIVNATWGGSRIEPWMSREALGLDAAGLDAVRAAERAREAATLAAIRARAGGALPTVDAGLVDGEARWAAPALDEAGWDSLPVPGAWEGAGWAGMDGVAWYRTAFELTAAEAAAGVRVGLGMIDDADVAWVNGHEIGRTEGWNRARAYDVPAAALRAGRNVLAVRVTDTGGGGGIHGAAALLYVQAGDGRRPLAGRWRFRLGAVSVDGSAQRATQAPTLLWNRMVHPLLASPIRGVLWYQGESNADTDADAAAYAARFRAMIAGWRAGWGQGDLPFLFVQLAAFHAADAEPPARSAWATLREGQAAALALPATAQAVAIDVGDADDIHPRDKQTVGRRLALGARRVAYGHDVRHAGPVLRGHRVEGGRVLLDLEHGGAGLVARGADGRPAPDGRLGGFAVAGADRRWVWAEARLEGGRVVVWSDRVPAPAAVRYAWSDNPAGANLFDGDGLPAAPFRTDRW